MQLANKLVKLYEKKSDYEIYHDSYTSAIKEATDYAEKNGYTLDDNQLATDVGFNSSRPKGGDTTKVTIDLYKNEKLFKKKLHVQVYNRETKGNTFELNMYIS